MALLNINYLKLNVNHNMFVCHCRDVREAKSVQDSYSRELARKENQIRDLQARLENGEGSKCTAAPSGRVRFRVPPTCRPASCFKLTCAVELIPRRFQV